jgi:hypothetical protein
MNDGEWVIQSSVFRNTVSEEYEKSGDNETTRGFDLVTPNDYKRHRQEHFGITATLTMSYDVLHKRRSPKLLWKYGNTELASSQTKLTSEHPQNLDGIQKQIELVSPADMTRLRDMIVDAASSACLRGKCSPHPFWQSP